MSKIEIKHVEKITHPFGQVSISKRKADGSVVEHPVFTNTFTWYGMTRIYGQAATVGDGPNHIATNGLAGYLRVGTGTVPITKDSTGLTSPLGNAVTSQTGSGSTKEEVNGKLYLKSTFYTYFPLGGIVGTLTELGLFGTNGLDTMVCGTLIKDEFGSPVAIPVADDEQLVLTYVLFTYLGEASKLVSGSTIGIGGIDYDHYPSAGAVNVGGVEYPYDLYTNGRSNGATTGTLRLPATGLTVLPIIFSSTPVSPYTTLPISTGGGVVVANVTVDNVGYKRTIALDVTLSPVPSGDCYIRQIRIPGGGNVSKAQSTAVINFTTPIPKTSMEEVSFSLTYTVDWSGT